MEYMPVLMYWYYLYHLCCIGFIRLMRTKLVHSTVPSTSTAVQLYNVMYMYFYFGVGHSRTFITGGSTHPSAYIHSCAVIALASVWRCVRLVAAGAPSSTSSYCTPRRMRRMRHTKFKFSTISLCNIKP